MCYFLAYAVLLAATLPVHAEYADTVRFVMGQELRCEVLKTTYKEISVIVVDVTAAYPIDQIAGIDWASESIPPSMSMGRRQFAEEHFAEAAASFAAAAAAKNTRTVLRQECMFMEASCHRRAHHLARGADAYRRLLTAAPDTYYFRDAVLGQVDCLTGDDPPRWAEAHQVLKNWSSEVKANQGDDLFEELQLAEARIFEREGRPLSALEVYSGLTTHRAPHISWAAHAGLGACQLAQGQGDAAEATFRKVVDGAPPSQVDALRRAWNGLGECRLRKGASTADAVKEALLCFLRTVTLYVPAPEERNEDHRIALMFAARCCHALASLETGERARDHYETEFQKLKARFREEYGDSTPGWEKKIEEPF